MSTASPELHVYDTTLRDGAQQEGLNLTVADKLSIARQLDGLGVGFIEGGWPGANPKDTEFFRRAAKELDLRTAVLAAFGATRMARGATDAVVSRDDLVMSLRSAGAGELETVTELNTLDRLDTHQRRGESTVKALVPMRM